MSDSWLALRRFTQARIALGRSGHAVPTRELLEFQLAHAEARDAVQLAWDVNTFAGQLRGLGEEALVLDTPVTGRSEYLRRPDLGRVLSQGAQERLKDVQASGADVALIVTNGLSSTAVARHGLALLQAIVNCYREHRISIAPITLVPNGRVALADQIGSLLAARVAVIMVGERPGLSAADSLGLYLTFAPQPGNSDARRNCISNIRPPEGLGYADTAAKLLYLTVEAIKREISGVGLKDELAGRQASNICSIPS